MSPSPATSTCPSPSRRSRTACASAYDTLQPRKRTEKLAIEGTSLVPHGPNVCSPAPELEPVEPRPARGLRRLRLQVPGGDGDARGHSLEESLDDAELDV